MMVDEEAHIKVKEIKLEHILKRYRDGSASSGE
jgi:hypothetical protein